MCFKFFQRCVCTGRTMMAQGQPVQEGLLLTILQVAYWLAGACLGVCQGYAHVAAELCHWLGFASLGRQLQCLASFRAPGHRGAQPDALARPSMKPSMANQDAGPSGKTSTMTRHIPHHGTAHSFKEQQAQPPSTAGAAAAAAPSGLAASPAAAAGAADAPFAPAEVTAGSLEFIPLTAPSSLAHHHPGSSVDVASEQPLPQMLNSSLQALTQSEQQLVLNSNSKVLREALAAPLAAVQQQGQQGQGQQQVDISTALDQRLSSFALDHISPATTATTLALAPASWAQEGDQDELSVTDPNVDMGVGPLEPLEGELDMAVANSRGSNLLLQHMSGTTAPSEAVGGITLWVGSLIAPAADASALAGHPAGGDRLSPQVAPGPAAAAATAPQGSAADRGPARVSWGSKVSALPAQHPPTPHGQASSSLARAHTESAGTGSASGRNPNPKGSSNTKQGTSSGPGPAAVATMQPGPASSSKAVTFAAAPGRDNTAGAVQGSNRQKGPLPATAAAAAKPSATWAGGAAGVRSGAGAGDVQQQRTTKGFFVQLRDSLRGAGARKQDGKV